MNFYDNWTFKNFHFYLVEEKIFSNLIFQKFLYTIPKIIFLIVLNTKNNIYMKV